MIARGLVTVAGLLTALLLLAHLVGTDGPAFVIGFAALDLLALYLGLAIAGNSWRPWR